MRCILCLLVLLLMCVYCQTRAGVYVCVCGTCLTSDGSIMDEMGLYICVAAVLGRSVTMVCVWLIIVRYVYKLEAVNVF